MRILQITHGLPPESVGGVEQHVQGLAGALIAAGHTVEILARSSRDGAQGSLAVEEWNGCRVTRIVYRWEGLTAMVDMYRRESMDEALRGFLADRRAAGVTFDVAHIHHLTGFSTGFVAVLREASIRVVFTLHDYWMMCPRGQMFHREERACESAEPAQCAACLTPAIGHWLPSDQATGLLGELHELTRKTLLETDQLLTPSARTIPFFEGFGVPAGRIAVVENGVDTVGLQTVPAPLTTGPLRVGYLGTLIPSKGLDVLIRAFVQTFLAATPRTTGAGEGTRGPDHPSATLTIHGNFVPYHGDEGFQERAFSNLPEAAPIHYHGPYTTADLPRLFAGIDVLVAPALWHEAFGLTVREAQAAGRAVIVSRIGGVQDAVTDGVEGLVVAPGDEAELGAALQRLAADRELCRRMGTAGRARTRGFAAMADEILTHYRGAAKLDPGGAGA